MEDAVIAVSRKVIGLLVFGIVAVSLVSLSAYTKYIYAQDYTFVIEAKCDPAQQTCYVRDCDEYCPPSGLAIYNIYEISAYSFNQCTTNGCENICHNEATSQLCTEISCDSENGDDCSG